MSSPAPISNQISLSWTWAQAPLIQTILQLKFFSQLIPVCDKLTLKTKTHNEVAPKRLSHRPHCPTKQKQGRKRKGCKEKEIQRELALTAHLNALEENEKKYPGGKDGKNNQTEG